MTDRELVYQVLARRDLLSPQEASAFRNMMGRLELEKPLSQRQSTWLYDVAERLGIATAPAANLFSDMDAQKQAEHRRRATSVQLPWEQPGYRRPLKPPGRNV